MAFLLLIIANFKIISVVVRKSEADLPVLSSRSKENSVD